MVRYFLWSGSSSEIRARVAWEDCSVAKKFGGLGLLDAEEAMNALMAKWLLRALLPGSSNLQLFLRYHILQF